jgi:preprotein translocase SecE subunit
LAVPRNRKRAKERRARRPRETRAGRPGIPARAEGLPGPIEHAAPDVELADAQLAVGRPASPDESPEAEEELELEAEERQTDQPEASVPAVAQHRGGLATRLVGFLQGSWRELQRVQWPDRRQVVQATGVVIGFVIVAGVYLGLADTVASKLMTFILK